MEFSANLAVLDRVLASGEIIWTDEEQKNTPCEQLRGTVIVSHGGGFVMRAGHEGFHTARRFLDLGFNVAVLTYRLAPYTRMDALADIQRAVRLLRANREHLHISDRIALLGYSAGGMLSANGATHYDAGNPQADDPVERQSCRPDAAVLCMMRLPRLRSRAGCLKIPSAMAGRSGFVWRQRRTSPPTRRRFSSGRPSRTIRATGWPWLKS